MASADVREELTCSICLSIFTDPVNLICGHNFCRICIKQLLDTQVPSAVYTCPQCRKRFRSRPALQKNTTLCSIVKHFQPVSPEQTVNGIFCTYCTETRVPAAKSCLLCEASLCNIHLGVHSKSPEHVAVEPTTFSKNRKCPVHTKFLDYFCPEDAACVYCQAGVHRRHLADQQTKPAEREKLKNVVEQLTSKKEWIADRIQCLEIHRADVQKNAANYSEQTTAIFEDIKKKLRVLEKRVLNEIMRQEEQVLLSISNLIRQLELKKNTLSRQILHTEELCNMVGTSRDLWVSESESVDLGNSQEEETESRLETGDEKFRVVGDFVGILISETLHRDLLDIVTDVKPLSYGPEAIDVLLDPKTSGCDVVVSADQRTASWSKIKRAHPKNPERFQMHNQVLSTMSFSPGRYYWEVETSNDGNWRIGVAYPTMDRISQKARIGDNKQSWCLCRWKNEYSVIHENRRTTLSKKVLYPRLGIFLNSWAGTLSFYELGDPIEHLYTITTTFSEPLHAALCVGLRGWLRIRSRRHQSS